MEQPAIQQRLYLASSFRGAGVAAMIMSDIEQFLQKIPSDIKISYIITAGNLHPEGSRDWIVEGRKLLGQRGWQVFDYDIEGKTESEVEQELADKDVIFVQGGNNFHLLKQMQHCNFASILRNALSRGVPYIGESAGSIVCANDISAQRFMSSDATLVNELTDYRGLGLVNFLIKPHWNRTDQKRAKFSKFLHNSPDEFFSITQPIICLNDNQLVFVDGSKFQIWEGE